MKRYTDKKAATYCNRVLNSARHLHDDRQRAPLENSWEDRTGRTYVCDGYRAYRLNACPDGISVLMTYHNPDPEKIRRSIEVHHYIERLFATIDDGAQIFQIDAPDPAAVEASKKSLVHWFDLGDGLPALNSHYLSDVMEMLPGCKWYCASGPRCTISPVYAISENGAAIILPLRTTKRASA